MGANLAIFAPGSTKFGMKETLIADLVDIVVMKVVHQATVFASALKGATHRRRRCGKPPGTLPTLPSCSPALQRHSRR